MTDDNDIPDPAEGAKEKLIRSKEKWAEEGRLLTGRPDAGRVNRLPPGQRLVTNWPVLDLGAQPDVKPEKWRLRIMGLVENPVVYTLDEFMALPQQEMASDIHCVTAWSRYDNRWKGVTSKALLEIVKPKPEVKHVLFQSYDGYTTNVALEVFAADNVLLAHEWEGQPLAREHGGPVRMVIPDWYFWKSPKWVTRIEFSASDRPGFWEVRGYHNQGDPWTEERYS
ncbi:MAG: sulfite oxidase-like oxidoreductase [Pseudomonadota bacterium]|nr:sulfite oxidase-like oxidoreductase [Pseudomonadota bacterium]